MSVGQDRKRQELEMRRRIIASGNEIGVEAIATLARTEIERIKDLLLRSDPAVVPPLQGEARAYAVVLKWITEPLREIDKPAE